MSLQHPVKSQKVAADSNKGLASAVASGEGSSDQFGGARAEDHPQGQVANAACLLQLPAAANPDQNEPNRYLGLRLKGEE